MRDHPALEPQRQVLLPHRQGDGDGGNDGPRAVSPPLHHEPDGQRAREHLERHDDDEVAGLRHGEPMERRLEEHRTGDEQDGSAPPHEPEDQGGDEQRVHREDMHAHRWVKCSEEIRGAARGRFRKHSRRGDRPVHAPDLHQVPAVGDSRGHAHRVEQRTTQGFAHGQGRGHLLRESLVPQRGGLARVDERVRISPVVDARSRHVGAEHRRSPVSGRQGIAPARRPSLHRDQRDEDRATGSPDDQSPDPLRSGS